MSSSERTGSRWVPLCLRWGVLFVLVAAPLAFGSVHEPAFATLIAASFLLGSLSWAHAHWERALGHPVPKVPAVEALLLLHGLVLVQLVPLPPRVLALLSPGSFSYHAFVSLGPLQAWRPISVSPPDTWRGLAFLVSGSLLYAAAFREFREPRWRNRLTATVMGTALLITMVAFVQAASAEPSRIYGIWKPKWDWGVFGPYVSKNHFAGYVVMAIPLALASAGSALRQMRRSWRARRIGWLALGDPEGTAAVRRLALAAVLVAGVVASRSRGGLMALVLSTLAAPLLARRRTAALLAVGALALVGFAMLDSEELVRGAQKGLHDSRFDVWRDALTKMVPAFPLLGSGLNTFGTAYPRYQSAWRGVWYGEAHNEYLQSLFDLGVLGAIVVLALLVRLLWTAARNARSSTVSAGLLGSLLAAACHNLVEFNWQIPANAATFAALAGLAMQEPAPERPRLDPPVSDA